MLLISLQALSIVISIFVFYHLLRMSDVLFKLHLQLEKTKIRLSKVESRYDSLNKAKQDKLSEL
jgi:hypothetical protein